MKFSLPLYGTLALLTVCPNFAHAQEAPATSTTSTTSTTFERSSGDDPAWAKFASNGGNLAFLAAGTLLPLATDGKAGGQHSLRTVDALIVSTLVAEGLKTVTHEKRPDGTDDKSFPSGHATAAFTVAAMQAHYHPKQALLWYAGATAIGASRVTLDRHYTHDVIAGAALGYFSAQLELKQGRGLVLRPFIRPQTAGNRSVGLSVGGSF